MPNPKFIELWPRFAVRADLVVSVQHLEAAAIDQLPPLMRPGRTKGFDARVAVTYAVPVVDRDGRESLQTRVLEPATEEDYRRILGLLNGEAHDATA